jgi:hypothetical protein
LKKAFFSFVLVGFGAGLWLTLSTTAHHSLKKWDGKFASVLRQSLTQAGLTNEDVLFSVTETRGTANEPWSTQTIELKKINAEKSSALKKALEDAGARVEEVKDGGKRTLLVKRGNRLYQKITYTLQ